MRCIPVNIRSSMNREQVRKGSSHCGAALCISLLHSHGDCFCNRLFALLWIYQLLLIYQHTKERNGMLSPVFLAHGSPFTIFEKSDFKAFLNRFGKEVRPK